MTMKKVLEEIFVDHGTIKQMALDHNWCERTISEALKRPRNTALQMQIREVALKEYDGVMRRR